MNGMHTSIRVQRKRLLWAAACCLALFFLSGCFLLPQAAPQQSPPGQLETQVAGQVASLATNQAATDQVAARQATIEQAAQATIQAAQATAEQAARPSDTLQPTYTPAPTYTSFPTYTPLPSFTPAPVLVPSPTPTAASSGCCTLRVTNRYKKTYWIGAKMPYGGNYIKPLWYVEFYPHQPTWMRIWWCRYTPYFTAHRNDYPYAFYQENWQEKNEWKFCTYWQKDGHLYDCLYRDVYVDQPLQEINIP